MPFILRGVNLLGINSVDVPRELRVAIWQRIATDLRPRHLALMESAALTLDTLMPAFQPYVDGKITGRTLVRLS
jgi:acrylyl-CoA reductase (NADPH)